jgi:hypothetical protein
VENGDLNWILPGKLLAFSGPAARPTDYVGFRAMVPEDYWEYFRKRGVQAIVRLNKKVWLAYCRKEAQWHASDCCISQEQRSVQDRVRFHACQKMRTQGISQRPLIRDNSPTVC